MAKPHLRPVAGNPGYWVSNTGELWSTMRRPARRLGSLSTNGYPQVKLHGSNYLVHRLVAQAFLPAGAEGPCVRHLDGNKLNSHVNNLAFGSHRDNRQDRERHRLARECSRS